MASRTDALDSWLTSARGACITIARHGCSAGAPAGLMRFRRDIEWITAACAGIVVWASKQDMMTC